MKIERVAENGVKVYIEYVGSQSSRSLDGHTTMTFSAKTDLTELKIQDHVSFKNCETFGQRKAAIENLIKVMVHTCSRLRQASKQLPRDQHVIDFLIKLGFR